MDAAKNWFNGLEDTDRRNLGVGVAVGVTAASGVLLWQATKAVPVPPVEDYAPASHSALSQYEEGTHFVTASDAEHPLRMGKTGVASLAPRTVVDVLKAATSNFPDHPALKVERPEGTWVTWTWQQYWADIHTAARAFVALGLGRFQAVNIMGFNCPEWHIANMAAIVAGGKAAGIYSTNDASACKYIIDHSQGVIAVVEDQGQLAKLLAIRDELPHLQAIVMWTGEVPAGTNVDGKVAVYTWAAMMELGKGAGAASLQAEVEDRVVSQKTSHCCTLIYTSGTTGNPKAVMLSHDNLTWTTTVLATRLDQTTERPQEEHVLSYLPLSHVAAQLIDMHFPMGRQASGVPTTTWFARPTALKGTLGLTLRAARPTMFFGVPRVWEKMMESMKKAGASGGGLSKKIAAWAKAKGLEGHHARQVGGSGMFPAGYGIAKKLVFSKVRAKLGLDRCRTMISGAAPISRETLDFFGSLDVPIMEVYGMSECTGPQTLGAPTGFKTGSCGRVIPGAAIMIQHEEGRDAEGEGEICFRGRHIMMGYMGDPDKTQKAIDRQGWLHSGDVGRMDQDGFLFITGRIKELIVTAGGENIAPVPIEAGLKALCPAISNCMMVGDRRKYNVVLVTLKTKPSPTADGTYTSELTAEAAVVSANSKTVDEAINDPSWRAYLEQGITENNKVVVSRAAKIQKFVILPTDFSIPGGELGPTLKLKRPQVMKKYAAVIDSLYQ